MSWSGTLRFVDIGTGQWVLETSSGKVSLFGAIDSALDGKRVVVEGKSLDGMSIGMVSGKAVEVTSVRAS